MHGIARRSLRTLVVLAGLLAAPPAAAQQPAPVTVEPGMTRAQVIERLGTPASVRTSGEHTYLFYRNGCERTCGMHDLVVLRDDAVVDAIFRAKSRRFTGESSSPEEAPPTRPARARLPAGSRQGGIVTGGDITGGAAAATPGAGARAARRPTAAAAARDSSPGAREAARPRRVEGGQVRVPIVPRDTQLPVPAGERGKRTLPGPVIVPTLPRDTQVARPDSARPQQPPRPRPANP